MKSKEVKRAEAEMNDAMEEFLLASADRLENNFKNINCFLKTRNHRRQKTD